MDRLIFTTHLELPSTKFLAPISPLNVTNFCIRYAILNFSSQPLQVTYYVIFQRYTRVTRGRTDKKRVVEQGLLNR